VELTTSRCKNKHVTKCYKGPRTWTDSVDKRPKLKKIYMKFGTSIVRSLYRAGLLRTVAEESSEYKLAPNQQANIHFSMERGIRIMN
jgi:hypothetical protein